MINIYSQQDISLIRESGKITAGVLDKVLRRVAPGISTLELDKYADGLIEAAGGKASFKSVKGYGWATCMCVNDCVVHGIPTDYKLQEGDRLGVDMGTFYKGFHSDASRSMLVGSGRGTGNGQISRKFLETGEKSLKLAIGQCIPGNHIGDISKTIQETIEEAGYSCVKQLVGHGVGKELHEDPEIPCYLRSKIEKTPLVKSGMVLAIEVIYNMGASPVIYAGDDGWTIVTRDGSLSGLFEHTVAVNDKGAEVLTKS